MLDTTTGIFGAPVTVVDAFTSATYDNATVQTCLRIECQHRPVPVACSAVARDVEANVVDQHGNGLCGRRPQRPVWRCVVSGQVSSTTTWSGAFTLPSGVQPG